MRKDYLKKIAQTAGKKWVRNPETMSEKFAGTWSGLDRRFLSGLTESHFSFVNRKLDLIGEKIDALYQKLINLAKTQSEDKF